MQARVALVGAGRWARVLLPALTGRFDVTRCCTRGSGANVRWLSREYPGVSHTGDLGDVLADPAVDAVVIATPPEFHADAASRSLAARKHVFVEKPLATSVADANRLAEQAGSSDRVLFVGHVYLYHPLLARLQAEIEGDPPRIARFSWRKLGTFDSDLFWNLVSHDVSLALALFGETPADVELLASWGSETACDAALVRLDFPGGRRALLEVDRASPVRSKEVSVLTESGRVLVWRDDALHEVRDGEASLLGVTERAPLDVELDAFAAAVESGTRFPSSARHGAAVVATVERARALLVGAA